MGIFRYFHLKIQKRQITGKNGKELNLNKSKLPGGG